MNSSSGGDFCLCFYRAPRLQGLRQESADAAFAAAAVGDAGMRAEERSHAGKGELRTNSLLRWDTGPAWQENHFWRCGFRAGAVEIPGLLGGLCVAPATSSGKQTEAAAPSCTASTARA